MEAAELSACFTSADATLEGSSAAFGRRLNRPMASSKDESAATTPFFSNVSCENFEKEMLRAHVHVIARVRRAFNSAEEKGLSGAEHRARLLFATIKERPFAASR